MSGRGVTETYERRLWDELNALLADTVPEEASRLTERYCSPSWASAATRNYAISTRR